MGDGIGASTLAVDHRLQQQSRQDRVGRGFMRRNVSFCRRSDRRRSLLKLLPTPRQPDHKVIQPSSCVSALIEAMTVYKGAAAKLTVLKIDTLVA